MQPIGELRRELRRVTREQTGLDIADVIWHEERAALTIMTRDGAKGDWHPWRSLRGVNGEPRQMLYADIDALTSSFCAAVGPHNDAFLRWKASQARHERDSWNGFIHENEEHARDQSLYDRRIGADGPLGSASL